MKDLALIGYGSVAAKHLQVLRELGAEITASCNRSRAGQEKAREEGGIPRTYADIETMLAAESPAGLVCCVSFDSMYEVGKRIIPAGIPILLEKPPGTSVAEALELEELARRHKTPVMVGLNRRHYSVLQNALDDAGGLEAITAVFLDWSETPERWLERGSTPDQIARMVFANSLHGLDLLTYLAGDVRNADVAASTFGDGPFRWQMSLHGVSERGVLVNFRSTWDSPGRWGLTFCTKGRRYTFAPLESCLVLEEGTGTERAIQPDESDQRFKPGFFRQAEAFLHTVATRTVLQGYDLATTVPAMRLAEQLTVACVKESGQLAGRVRT
ncbi:MAG: hypothetical protein CMJ48_01685 [Planctomycetaceae bacterium]|nr:hypothetical protein [Planctomycetaceae bacterium]